MGKKLTSDELGAAGEALFAGLSVRASLVCNKSDRDRTGWDFVVEFPMPKVGVGVTLDKRLPTACAVQLKSTTRAGAVRLRLSAAERLAKDLRPAFIIVFHLNPTGEGSAGYLIHLLGPALRKTLHRLRTVHANKTFDVNRVKISFDYQKLGTSFPLTPEGLKQALLSAIGDERTIYVAEKQRQLNELGYEDGGLEGEVLIWAENVAHLNNIVLGLVPIRRECLQTFDTRFGIRLPYTGPAFESIEELRVKPPTVGPCVVSIRSSGLSPAAAFDAEMLAGLTIAGSETWLLVRHAEFTLKLGSDAAIFDVTGEFGTTLRSLSAWISLMRALTYLASGDGLLTLTLASQPNAQLTLSMASKLDGPYLEHLPEWLCFLVGWEQLLNLAGTPASEPFTLEDLWAAYSAAQAVNVFGNQPSHVWFALDRSEIRDSDASPPISFSLSG